MRSKQLPVDYALVLQQLSEDGKDDLYDLAEIVQIDRYRLRHVIKSLHHKGLITIDNIGYNTWLSLSSKGRRLMRYLWPESGYIFTG